MNSIISDIDVFAWKIILTNPLTDGRGMQKGRPYLEFVTLAQQWENLIRL